MIEENASLNKTVCAKEEEMSTGFNILATVT